MVRKETTIAVFVLLYTATPITIQEQLSLSDAILENAF
jgi:hypothetical protein